MRTRELLNPLAYPRLARSYGRLLRAIVQQSPETKVVSAQWLQWTLRRLLLPIYRVPFILTSRTGSRFALGDDPVDDSVFRHIHGHGRVLYFPLLANGEPEGLILDVGAHHGIYAMEALRRYPRCTLMAIEPDPAACQTLAANARLNDLAARIEIVQAGIADVDGQGWLVFDENGSWASRTLAIDPRSAETPPAGQFPVPVALKTLASILSGRQPTIVKCNAEGAEFALIPQLLALGHRPRLIVLMVHPEAGAADLLLRPLVAAGYNVRDADTPPRGFRFHCFLKQRGDEHE